MPSRKKQKIGDAKAVEVKEEKFLGFVKLEDEENGVHYKCDKCGKLNPSRTKMKIHVAIHGEKPHKCQVEGCSSAFMSKSELAIHTNRHNKIQPYSCDLCEKKFGSVSNLNAHKVFHQPESRFACDVCDRRFKIPFDLRRHKTKVHEGAGTRATKKLKKRKQKLDEEVAKLDEDQKTDEVEAVETGEHGASVLKKIGVRGIVTSTL